MTFYEAAVEVLRRSGRPLHFKKITETAIKDHLLSHVGKTPEVTMEDRLAQETKKEDASWIVRTRPGVYMLREDVAKRLNEEAKAREEENRKAKAEQVEDEPEQDEPEEQSRAKSDDEPSSGESGGRSRRRRRRRGRRNGESTEKTNGEAAKESRGERGGRSRSKSQSKSQSRSRSNSKSQSGSRGKSKSKPRSNGKASSASLKELDGERFDSIAEAAFAVVHASDRKPMTATDIADVVFDKKLVRFHTHDPEATIQSAIVTDNQVRVRRGLRPLFSQYRRGAWGLTEWGVSDDGIEKEQNILELADELRSEALKQLGDAVASLKAEAFEMVVMTLLERLDYGNLKVSKRTSDGDVFFTADWKRGFSDLRVCIHIVADPESRLEAAEISDLRETLEHYSASEGVVIHLGEISKGAVKETRDESQAKVTVIDRNAFVRLLVEEGIGVKTFQTPIVMVDTAFIDALQP